MKVFLRYLSIMLVITSLLFTACGSNDDDDQGERVDITDFAIGQVQNNTRDNVDPIDINNINFIDKNVLRDVNGLAGR